MKWWRYAAIVFISVALYAFPRITPALERDEGFQRVVARAENGDAQAQTDLAVKYEHGEGVARNFSLALRYYCLAARQGYVKAQYNLGWMYANGRGVPRDDAIAAAWFKLAASRGDPYAGRMLKRLGTPPGTLAGICPASTPALSRRPRSTPPPRTSPERSQIEQWVHELAPQYGLNPRLVLAVIKVESLFNPKAQSSKNARGLMQLIPATAERFGVQDTWDPVQNLKGGMAYLRWLLALFKGDLKLALAGYNAGERAVEAHRGIPPYAETQKYVEKVTRLFGSSRHPYLAEVVKPSPLMAKLEATKAEMIPRAMRHVSDLRHREARTSNPPEQGA